MTSLPEYEFVLAKSIAHFAAARKLFQEYADSLNFDLHFQNFEQELNEIDIQYNLPSGGLLLIRHHQAYIGCAGVRKFENKVGELKRMYIKPAYRGSGLGQLLLEKLLVLAKEIGYERVRLDTLRTMESALHLYQKLGFYGIASYRFNPDKDVLYFEKRI